MNIASPRIRVLCVDDHPLVRQGIATLLSIEADMELVGQAQDGREGLEQFRALQPDVTLMDLQMPGTSGLDSIRAIRAEFPQARIIVLTTFGGDAQVGRALEAGAVGYLLKNALHKELLEAIRTVYAGRGVLPSAGSQALAGEVVDDALTPAEIAVLRFIADGNVLPEIAHTLALDPQEVERQLRGILSKLDAQDRAQAHVMRPVGAVLDAERAARHAAEAANRAKSQFLAGMSHELRTPLNAILGYAQLLTMEGGLSARQARGLETIHQSGEHLLALVNDILDLARIEAGRTELNPRPLALAALLEDIVHLMRVRADEKRLEFAFDANPHLPQNVLADERRLRQVLLNLLSNAIKFTDNGTVTLCASAEQAGPASVLLRLTVQDTGVGMRPEDLSQIFKPFVQVGDVQRRQGGTGLGLAITRALVHDMGGQIQVSSEFGRGTRFTVDLPFPVVSASAVGSARSARLTRYAGPPRRVLVVDGVAASRALLCDFLRGIGFDVSECADGNEVLTMAQQVRPDLILMDSSMPTMGGLEASRLLKADVGLAAVPVIVLSALATAEHSADCLRAGAGAFLTKPVSLAALQECLGELLGLQWIE